MALITGFDMFTRKVVSDSQVIDGSEEVVSACAHTYTFPYTHKLHIFGGFTCVGVSSDFHSHWAIKIDGDRVFAPDQHDTPQAWWHQGFSFLTADLDNSQHVCSVTGTNQSGNYQVIGASDGSLTQICYQIVTL